MWFLHCTTTVQDIRVSRDYITRLARFSRLATTSMRTLCTCRSLCSARRSFTLPAHVSGIWNRLSSSFVQTQIWGRGVRHEIGRSPDLRMGVSLPTSNQTTYAACGLGFALLYSKLSKSLVLLGSCGTEDTITVPFVSPSETPQSVDCGRAHVVVCSGDGHVYTAGHNVFGQCGYYSSTEVTMSVVDCLRQSAFQRIDGLKEKAVQVACGLDHSLILTKKGTVYSCGWGADGQTGLGSNRNETIPHQVYGHLEGRQVKQIATSADCSLAVATDGTVYGWGTSEYQQLGIDTTEMQVTVPTVIPGDLFDGKVVQVASGGSFSLFLTAAGTVYSVGYGAGLGLGENIIAASVPKVVSFVAQGDDEVSQIHASVDYAAAVTRNGNLFVWGHNRHNQFGPHFEQCEDLWRPNHVTLPFRIDNIHLGVDCMAVTGKNI